jgi:hypothetical protein
VVECGSKIGHQKDTCLKEVTLRAQNVLIILGSIINFVGGTYVIRNKHVNLDVDNE